MSIKLELDYIWRAAIDWARSSDFQDLPEDERDASYINYRDNVIAQTIEKINQMSDHAHNWVLIDTYDSYAKKPSLHNIRDDIHQTLADFDSPHTTSETWTCECGERKTNHRKEPSAIKRMLDDSKPKEDQS